MSGLAPDEIKKLIGAVKEISDSMTRTDAERDLIKDIVKTVSDDLQLPGKMVRKLATTYHEQNLAEVEQEHEDFVNLYETMIRK